MGARRRCDAPDRRGQQQSRERNQRRRERNRRETVGSVQCCANRRAECEGGVHGRPHPGQDLAGVSRAGERQPPRLGSRDNEALASAENRPSEQQDRHRGLRLADKTQRHEIEKPGGRRREKASDHGLLRAPRVGLPAGPYPRNERRGELAACDQADDEGAKAEALMHM